MSMIKLKSGIYQIRNRLTGDLYIGSSIHPRTRKSQHFSSANAGKHHSIIFQRAWEKYGEDVFEFKILESCASEDLLKREQFYIDNLNPKYNISMIAGKPPAPPNKPIKRTHLETGEVKIYRVRDDVLEDGFNEGEVTACCLGNTGTHKGYTWEFEDGSSPVFQNTKLDYALIRTDDLGNVVNYPSLKDALECGEDFTQSGISACCLNSIKRHRGYNWEYASVDNIAASDNVKSKGMRIKRTSIKNDSDVKFYKSLAEAGNEGFSTGNIYLCCNGKRGSHNGYIWQYEGLKIPFKPQSKPVIGINIKDGSILKYMSTANASIDGFNSSKVGACCRGNRRTHNGYYWKYNDSDDFTEIHLSDPLIKQVHNPTPIIPKVPASAPPLSDKSGGRSYKECPYCNLEVSPFLKHIETEHPADYRTQIDLVLKLWEAKISSRKIAIRDDIIFTGGTSVRRILSKFLTPEELESGRREMIGIDVKRAYDAGEREWVSEINIARNKSEDGRAKNSKGVREAYKTGVKESLNDNSTLRINRATEFPAKIECLQNTPVETVVRSDDSRGIISEECDKKPIVELAEIFNGKVQDDFAIINGIKVYVIPILENTVDRSKVDKMKSEGALVFFNDEWYTSRHIVLSVIRNKIIKASSRIWARKCSIVEVKSSIASKFFKENHLSGNVPSSKYWGLKYNNEIICMISVRKPFIRKHMGSIEIARFATKCGFLVVGGLSKLLAAVKVWSLENGFTSILSYADLRMGEGNAYQAVGFELVGKTGSDYFYTDGHKRYNRFKFRAQPGKPEKEVAKDAGVHKVYGCGSNIFKLDL